MSHARRNVPRWAEDCAPKPDFEANPYYVARVKKPFVCPAYTKAYPDGKSVFIRTNSGEQKKLVYNVGEEVSIVSVHYADGYLSALVHPSGHWINLWTIFNKEGKPRPPRGISFCEFWPKQLSPRAMMNELHAENEMLRSKLTELDLNAENERLRAKIHELDAENHWLRARCRDGDWRFTLTEDSDGQVVDWGGAVVGRVVHSDCPGVGLSRGGAVPGYKCCVVNLSRKCKLVETPETILESEASLLSTVAHDEGCARTEFYDCFPGHFSSAGCRLVTRHKKANSDPVWIMHAPDVDQNPNHCTPGHLGQGCQMIWEA